MFKDLSKLAQSTSRDGAFRHQSVISPLNPAAASPNRAQLTPINALRLFTCRAGTQWFPTGDPRGVFLLPWFVGFPPGTALSSSTDSLSTGGGRKCVSGKQVYKNASLSR